VLCTLSLQVAALVFGDESATLSQPVGYRGEHTLSMRSTKVSGWVGGGCHAQLDWLTL
jgi:hypothetical protein